MQVELLNINLREADLDLRAGIVECNKRGLLQSAKWLAEMNFSLKVPDSVPKPVDTGPAFGAGIADSELKRYHMAKAHFDCREYDRAAYFTSECNSPVPKFLHLYSQYMAREKRKLDNMTEDLLIDNAQRYDKGLQELMDLLKKEHHENKLDGYCLYLYGVILKKLDLNEQALNVLLEAVRQVPTLWAAWFELSPLVHDKQQLYSLSVPQHWMRHIFYAHTLVELFLNDDGIKLYEELEAVGFTCSYTTSQLAIAYHNNRDVERAIEIFDELQRQDPFRLDNLDMYSNLLFVKEMRVEMAQLAHKVIAINKYRPETCCVIGNYYSIRTEHQKAILYFQRALKLNPKYLSAWTLMGHEFMETKNTNGAIQSYRKAIEVNRRDFRAWYGLGQAYEIMKMPIYSLYYYKKSHQLRPSDSRMLVALGETYEKLDRSDYALKCYQKACNVGDIEGIALSKLANLYEKMGDMKNAVPALLSFCAVERPLSDKVSVYRVYLKLAQYYETVANYREAQHHAQMCLEHEETKMEGRALLKTINKKQEAAKVAAALITADVHSVVDMDETSANVDDVPMDESDLIVETALNAQNTREEDTISISSFSSKESLSRDYSDTELPEEVDSGAGSSEQRAPL